LAVTNRTPSTDMSSRSSLPPNLYTWSRRCRFRCGRRGVEYSEELLLLTDDGALWVQLFLQRQAGVRFREAEQPLAAGQLDQVELDFTAVNHRLILHENRRIATCR